jgi:hypothetical protein
LREKKGITLAKTRRRKGGFSLRLSAAADRAFLLVQKKKKLARKDAKPQRVFSLRLCAFARQKTKKFTHSLYLL